VSWDEVEERLSGSERMELNGRAVSWERYAAAFGDDNSTSECPPDRISPKAASGKPRSSCGEHASVIFASR